MREENSPEKNPKYYTRSMKKNHPELFQNQQIFDQGLQSQHSNQAKKTWNNCPKNMVVILRSPAFRIDIENTQGVAWKLYEVFLDRSFSGTKNLISFVFGNEDFFAEKHRKSKEADKLRKAMGGIRRNQQVNQARKFLRNQLLEKLKNLNIGELIDAKDKCKGKQRLKMFFESTMHSLKKEGRVPLKLSGRNIISESQNVEAPHMEQMSLNEPILHREQAYAHSDMFLDFLLGNQQMIPRSQFQQQQMRPKSQFQNSQHHEREPELREEQEHLQPEV